MLKKVPQADGKMIPDRIMILHKGKKSIKNGKHIDKYRMFSFILKISLKDNTT